MVEHKEGALRARSYSVYKYANGFKYGEGSRNVDRLYPNS